MLIVEDHENIYLWIRLILTRLWAYSADDKLMTYFFFFSPENRFQFDISWKFCMKCQNLFSWLETICMKCQNMFSWRNKKTVLKFVHCKFYLECWALISRKREIRAVLQDRHNYIGLAMRKRVFGHMWKAKAHISLCICAVSSGPSMSTNRITGYYWKYELKQMPGWDIAHAREVSKSAFCACSKTAFRLARPI